MSAVFFRIIFVSAWVMCSFASSYAQTAGTTRVSVAVDPADQDFARAKMLFQIGEILAAVSGLERLIETYPQSPTAFDAIIFLGEIFLDQKQPEKAKKVAEKYIALNPKHADIQRVRDLLDKAQKLLNPPLEPKPEEIKVADTASEPVSIPASVKASSSQPTNTTTPDLIPVEPSTIGLVVPLSGQYAIYGERILTAVQLALGLPCTKTKGQAIFVQRNEKLTLVIGDSKGNAEIAGKLVEQLATQYHVIAVLGDVLMESSLSVAKKSQELGVPNLSLSRRDGLLELGSFIFRIGLTTHKQTRALVNHAMDTLQIKKFAILYPSHPYGIEMKNSFSEEVKQRGGQISVAIAYKPDETTFTSHAQKLIAPHADFGAIFIPDFAKTVSYIIPALVAQDFLVSQDPRITSAYRKRVNEAHPIQLLGPSSWNGDLLPQRLGNQIEGAMFVDGFDLSSAQQNITQFTAEYRRLTKSDPTVVEVQAYDAARILSAVVHPLVADSSPKTRAEFCAKLLDIKNFSGLVGNISFDQKRDSQAPVHKFVIKAGQLQTLP